MRFLLLLATAADLAAQSEPVLSIRPGFKIGAPINNPPSRNQIYSSYEQGRWTGGPTIEARFPHGFAVAFEALFRNYQERGGFPFQLGSNVNPYLFQTFKKANVWDFPLQLKYRFRLGPVRPFVSGGYQWGRESSESSSLYSCSGPQGSCRPPEYPTEIRGSFTRQTSSRNGLVAGAGIEFRTRYVTIAPEVRFTRPRPDGSRENRVTGLVGFTFGK